MEKAGQIYRYIGTDPITQNTGITLTDTDQVAGCSTSTPGEIYEYIGTGRPGRCRPDAWSTTATPLLWKQLGTSDYKDIFFPNLGNIQTTNAKAIGLSIAYNDARGDADGDDQNAVVDADGVGTDVW